MTNKHSALPWKARSGEDTNWWFILEDKDGLEIGSGDGGLEECDARLIAAAVNNYYRLREALDSATDILEDEGYMGMAKNNRGLLAELNTMESGS